MSKKKKNTESFLLPTERQDINTTTIYSSIRMEILDQKKCQFQFFVAAVTFSSAILAISESQFFKPVVLFGPVIINTIALQIIMEKAISIQRMVGYLQLMESSKELKNWGWEFHLNAFREEKGEKVKGESYRKHKYIRNISIMLISLNLISGFLYWRENRFALDDLIFALIGVLIVFGIVSVIYYLYQLIYGRYTSIAIKQTWLKVISANPV